MAQRLILHVGAPKTGTTYLQQLLWDNTDVLAAAGVHLPLDREGQRAASADLREAPWAGDFTVSWQALAEATNAVDGTAVVSEELLARTAPDRIAAFVEALSPGTAVDVVFGARDAGRQVPAMWQHAIRGRNAVTFSGYVRWLRDDPEASYWLEQDPVLAHDRWGAAGRFHVLTVPPPGSAPDLLWRRFAGILGVAPESVTPPAAPANESLGIVEAELLRRLNGRLGDRFPLWRPYVTAVRRHLIVPALATAPRPERIQLTAEAASWFASRARQTVETLLERDVVVAGDLADLAVSGTPAARTADDLSDSELLDGLLEALVRQLEHLDATRRDQPFAPAPSRVQRLRGRLGKLGRFRG